MKENSCAERASRDNAPVVTASVARWAGRAAPRFFGDRMMWQRGVVISSGVWAVLWLEIAPRSIGVGRPRTRQCSRPRISRPFIR